MNAQNHYFVVLVIILTLVFVHAQGFLGRTTHHCVSWHYIYNAASATMQNSLIDMHLPVSYVNSSILSRPCVKLIFNAIIFNYITNISHQLSKVHGENSTATCFILATFSASASALSSFSSASLPSSTPASAS